MSSSNINTSITNLSFKFRPSILTLSFYQPLVHASVLLSLVELFELQKVPFGKSSVLCVVLYFTYLRCNTDIKFHKKIIILFLSVLDMIKHVIVQHYLCQVV